MKVSESKQKDTVDDFEKKLMKFHPKFLETIREVYPLAVLGSLCIAIAAFTHESFPQAQVYAITAASLFLIAFTCAFAFKIVPTSLFAFFSYASTAFATLMLFLVVYEFSKAFPIIGSTLITIQSLFVLFIMSSMYFFLQKRVRETRNRLIRFSGWTSIVSGIVFICLFVIGVASDFSGVSIIPTSADIFGNVVLAFLLASMITLVFAFLLIFNDERGKKQEKRKG
jgi:hypothetical protein